MMVVESYMLPLRAYRRMFPNILTTDGLPKPDALQVARPHDSRVLPKGILPVNRTGILKGAHYKTGKLMPIKFLYWIPNNEVISFHVASTQYGILKVLCYNKTAYCRQINSIRTHTVQRVNMSTITKTTAVCPLKTTIQPFILHKNMQ